LNYVDRQMAYSIFPALRIDLRFSDAQLGLIGSVFAWVYSICMPIAGRFADILRRDRMIVASMGLWSIAILGCSFSQSVLQFLIWRAVMGVTEALYYPAAVALIAEAHSGGTRSKALGIHQSAQLAGIVVGGWYGGWMADHVSWRIGFAAAAMAGVVYSLILTKQLPVSRSQSGPRVGNPFRTSIELFRSPCYLALSAAFFAFCGMLWIFYAWLPSFLAERYNLSMTASGFRATVFVQVACGAGVVAGGVLADYFSRRIPAARFYVAAAGIALCAPFGYLTFAAESISAAAFCSSVYGFFSGLMIANVFAAAYDVVAPGNFGLAAGVLNMIGGFAATIMIFLAGLLKDTLGFAGLLRWVALGCLLAALLLVAVTRAQFGPDRRAGDGVRN